MNLLLIRHGATKANIDKRFQGTLDYPLSEEGKKQAELLAARLKDERISMIYTSDLIRAKDTAEEIKRYHDKKIALEVMPQLREYSWGIIEGLTREEIRLKYSELANKMEKNFWNTTIPKEEGILVFKERLQRVFNLLVERHLDDASGTNENIALVTHGRVLGGLIALITSYNLYDMPWPFVFSNASLTKVSVSYYSNEIRSRIVLLNDICHIKGCEEGITY